MHNPSTPMTTTPTPTSQPNTDPETFEYSVEINSLMSTIVNSMYSDKSLAFRELISNASDACDKYNLMYHTLSESNNNNDNNIELTKPSDLRITIESNRNEIIITDNGIGMTKSDLINFLGRISNSGTKKFKQDINDKAFDKTDSAQATSSLIGQFGLGFYSSFLIAEKVKVYSKHSQDGCHVWESSGLGDFSVRECAEMEQHGTRIVLCLRKADEKYGDMSVVEENVKKYSMFIPYPIYIVKYEQEEEKKVKDVEEENKNETENNTETENKNETEIKIDKKDGVYDDEPVIEEVVEPVMVTKKKLELINKDKPLWLSRPKDITRAQYTSFYKTISNDWEDFMAVKHVTLEGLINLTFLLFIPSRNKTSVFEKPKKDSIKLYVQNVFVTCDLKDCIPDWMSFVCGVVCSDDIPMNVSREICQGNNTMKMIKNNLSKKVLEMIEEMQSDSEKYESFIKEYGTNVKLGVKEMTGNMQERMAKCLRFCSSRSEKMVSIDEYIERRENNGKKDLKTDDNELNEENNENTIENKNDPKIIFVLTGLTKEEVLKSPFLSMYQDSEVLLMYEPIDEIMLSGFNSYKGYDIKRISSEGVSLNESINADLNSEFESFMADYKNLLAADVEKIRLRNFNNDKSPCVVSTGAYSHSPAMENIIRAQPNADTNPFLAAMGRSKKIFEINPMNSLIVGMKEMHRNGNENWKRYGTLLFNTAMIECGFRIEDGVVYAKKVFDFLGESVGNEKKDENIIEVDEVL